MGTPNFACPVLSSLIDNYEVVGVVSQPDKKVGRKQILTPTPIKEIALSNNIPVFQPVKIREDYESILECRPDIIVTCAYGQIIPKEIIDYPKYGCINVHASLLPKYRGGAPIHRAIMNGDEKTGITIMYMDEGMDTGDIISSEEVKIEDSDNLETLSLKLSDLGAKLLINTLPSIIDGTRVRTKQNEDEVTYAYNVSSEEEHIDFNKTSRDIYNLIRALSPNIGAYFMLDGERVKVYKARIGTNKYDNVGIINNIYKDGIGISSSDGEIVLEEIQVSGKKKMSVNSYLNGIKKETLMGKELK
ncbi:MAG: methionyl-tRNA formyltransferase [Bacilli bacterium]|nr:methionyl-tRNA formyltransferase [Bacilli bacterium]